jgi:predicted dehydrogenase
MRDFADTILAGGSPKVTGHDARQAVAVVLAAVRSVRESRPVKL